MFYTESNVKSLRKNLACLAFLCLLTGCEKKEEKVLDIETPAGGIEIKQSTDGVKIDLQSGDKGGDSIKIDVPREKE